MSENEGINDEVAKSNKTIRVVTMRVDSARLLVNNKDEWVTINKGIVFHVSFFQSASNEGMKKAVRKLLRFALISKGQWGDENAAPESILKLCEDNFKVDILVVPQANMIGKPSSSGNAIRYTDQLEKDKARDLYNQFCKELSIVSMEAMGVLKKKEKTVAELNKERLAKEAKNAQDPYFIFQTGDFVGKYSAYDDRGVPTHDISGETLSKAASKKCEKIYKSRVEKYKKAMEKKTKQGVTTATNDTEKTNEEEKETISSSLESDQACLPNIFCGVFGNRQGFECVSSGPTIHCLDL